MTNEQANEEISFKEFLNKSANLLTVFGIFNALTIYATSVKSTSVSQCLVFVFLCLSIVVLWEIIEFAIESQDGSNVYVLFILLIGFSEILFAWYLFTTFLSFITTVFSLSLGFVYYFLINSLLKKSVLKAVKWVLRRYTNYISRLVLKTAHTIYSLMMIVISFLLMFYTLKYLAPYLTIFLKAFEKPLL